MDGPATAQVAEGLTVRDGTVPEGGALEGTGPVRMRWTIVMFVAALFRRGAIDRPGLVDHRDGAATHRIWRAAAVGGGPGLR
jgi:hypothetical protein